ncbi:MAG: hypothetical protein ABEJ65_00945, partial [bacterium]
QFGGGKSLSRGLTQATLQTSETLHAEEIGPNVKFMTILFLGAFGSYLYSHMLFGTLERVFNYRGHRFGHGEYFKFSEKSPNYVLEHYPNERFYNSYGIGAYLIWKWWPRKKVFVDSKNLAYDTQFMSQVLRNPRPLIRQLNLQHAIVSSTNSGPFYFFIPHPKWSLEAFDKNMLIFRKLDEPVNVNPRSKLLYNKQEFQALPALKKKRIRAIMEFVRRYQNQEHLIGVFSGPHDRLKRPMKK